VAGELASQLATVPAEVQAPAAQILSPATLDSGRSDGRLVALPVAARWIALAWDPARLEESPTLVPPHLEAWIDQLRALHRSRPEQPPLIVAWDEANIAGSFALLLAANGGRLLDNLGQPAFTRREGEETVRLMMQMREEGLVQPTALETSAKRLAESLTGPYTYWLCPSDALIDEHGSQERWARLSMLRLSGLPRARAQYQYPDAATVSLVQYRGVAVPGNSRRPAAAWRLARFLADPVMLRSAPAVTSVLSSTTFEHPLARQAHVLMAQNQAGWAEIPGLNEALGRFLHAALRKLLTPREALERAALQLRQPGQLPAQPEAATSAPQTAEGSAASPGGPADTGSSTPEGGGGATGVNPATPPAASPATHAGAPGTNPATRPDSLGPGSSPGAESTPHRPQNSTGAPP
jgi:hypothetical protein